MTRAFDILAAIFGGLLGLGVWPWWLLTFSHLPF